MYFPDTPTKWIGTPSTPKKVKEPYIAQISGGKEVPMTENYENLRIISGSEIEPKEVDWLWYPYIPYGKITIVQGDPGEF